jgi:hypothetical protein
VEAAGIEPASDFDGTTDDLCDCENCKQCRAANALHFECFKGQFLASLDAELQVLIGDWVRLDDSTRKAIGELSHPGTLFPLTLPSESGNELLR